MRTTTTKRMALGAIALSIAIPALASGGSTVKADPPASLGLSYSGVGSDTTQAIMDAFSGQSNGISYARAISQGAVLDSYDATIQIAGSTDPCIITTFNGVSFTRPNGSGAGIKALSAANAHGLTGNVTKWLGDNAVFSHKVCGAADFVSPNNTAGIAATSAVNIAGQVAFARSSSGESGANTDLTWVPYAKDAVTAGYVFKNITGTVATPAVTLKRKDLIDIYNTGPKVINNAETGNVDVLLLACDINVASGTRKFFGGVAVANVMSGASSTTIAALAHATPTDPNGICNSVFEENQLNTPATRANALATANPTGITFGGTTYTNFELIVPHSAASFIAQENGVAPSALPSSGSYGITSISDNSTSGTGGANLGDPYTINTGVYTASSTFYADSVFGRFVFNVLPSTVMTTLEGDSTDAALRSLFFGPNSPICLGTSIISKFGFVNLAVGDGSGTTTCGSIGRKGSWSAPSSTLS